VFGDTVEKSVDKEQLQVVSVYTEIVTDHFVSLVVKRPMILDNSAR